MQEHQKDASQYRLNQSKNSPFANAAEVKRKVSVMKQQSRTEELDIDISLWIHPPRDDNGQRANPKKFNSLSTRITLKTHETSDYMLEAIVMKAKGLYANSPTHATAISQETLDVMFSRDTVQFGVVKSASTILHLDDTHTRSTTVAGVIANLKRHRGMSEKDIKGHTLSLRVYVYEDYVIADEEKVDDITSSIRGKRSAEPAPSAKRYQSAFRRRSAVPVISYEPHKFLRSVCTASQDGTINWVHSPTAEEIFVAKEWQQFAKGSEPQGGYISKGLSKYAFRARIGTTDYAILQCKPILSSEGSNSEDLSNELTLLCLSDYFMKSFYQRAEALNVVGLPRIRWNFDGAFIGKLVNPLPPVSSTDVDNRTFLWTLFLATPLLLNGSGYKEVKFSGNLDVGNNHDVLGRVVDAFAHHVVCDSDKTVLLSDLQGVVAPDGSLILFDPQAHTEDGDSGHWDKGSKQIDEFIRNHKCNKFCNALDLSFTSEI
ncbi:kinase-like domain-containing protein [Melanogaster broomeanus]|nr:kinase-like domain-containing protein [Melanogaster broomeanus]